MVLMTEYEVRDSSHPLCLSRVWGAIDTKRAHQQIYFTTDEARAMECCSADPHILRAASCL